MPAIKYALQGEIRAVINGLFDRVNAINTIVVTPKEMINSFAAPEYRELLMEARDIIELNYWATDFTITWPGKERAKPVTLSVHLDHNQCRAAAPKQPAIQEDIDPALVKRIDSWIDLRVKTGRQFGLVQAVFEQLVNKCGSPEQIRFYWPALMTLCAGNTELEPLLERLRAVTKPPNTIPKIEKGLADACQETAAIITMAHLLPPAKKVVQPAASLSLSGVDNRYLLEGVGYVTPK